MRRDAISRFLDQARKLGAIDLQIIWKKGHPALVGYRADGRHFRITFASTPSCPRARLNEAARLRRKLRSDTDA